MYIFYLLNKRTRNTSRKKTFNRGYIRLTSAVPKSR